MSFRDHDIRAIDEALRHHRELERVLGKSDLERLLIWARDTARLVPEQDRSIYYKVQREVTLRARPDPRAQPIALLLPRQKSRLVERRHKWIYVEYFDEIQGVARYGWANKKYLKKMDKTPQLKPTPNESVPFLTTDERTAITADWDKTNKRRVELIHKKLGKVITPTEKEELDRLQSLLDKRIRLLAPLPTNALASFLEEIERRT